MLKKQLLILLLEIYGFFLNFYFSIQYLRTKVINDIKAYAFDRHYSYIGLYQEDESYITLCNYESYSIWKLIIICLFKLFNVSLIVNADHPTYESIKYGIFKYYEDNQVYDFIICKSDNLSNNSMNEDLDETLDHSLDQTLNQSNIGYVIIDNQDITKEYNLYKQSIITNRINVKDFVNILKGMRVINYTQNYIIKILNLNTMEEQIFKANDILTL